MVTKDSSLSKVHSTLWVSTASLMITTFQTSQPKSLVKQDCLKSPGKTIERVWDILRIRLEEIELKNDNQFYQIKLN